MDTGSLIVLAAAAGFAAGLAVAAYFARDIIRHKRHLERLGFVASLNLIADGIGEDSDPRRIASTIQLKAGRWQRAADALDAKKSRSTWLPLRWC